MIPTVLSGSYTNICIIILSAYGTCNKTRCAANRRGDKGTATGVIYNSKHGPLSRAVQKIGSQPNPGHSLQLMIEMTSVGAEEGYLLVWTMCKGSALYHVRLAPRLVDALVTLSVEVAGLLGTQVCHPVEPGFSESLPSAICSNFIPQLCVYFVRMFTRHFCCDWTVD
jgi:hypothetical protein